jgi:hypothetical protein
VRNGSLWAARKRPRRRQPYESNKNNKNNDSFSKASTIWALFQRISRLALNEAVHAPPMLIQLRAMGERNPTLIADLVAKAIMLCLDVLQEAALARKYSPASLSIANIILATMLAVRRSEMVLETIAARELGATFAANPI